MSEEVKTVSIGEAVMTSLHLALRKLSIEELKKFQREALSPENGRDIWLALEIESELKRRS